MSCPVRPVRDTGQSGQMSGLSGLSGEFGEMVDREETHRSDAGIERSKDDWQG